MKKIAEQSVANLCEGTGFSPYIEAGKICGALAPEGADSCMLILNE